MRRMGSGSISRVIATGGLIVTLAATGACDDTGESTGSEEREDPAEFAAEVMQHGVDSNWDDVRPLLVEPFDEFEGDALQAGLAFPLWSESLTDPDRWEVDEHTDFTVARSAERPHQAMTLIPDGDSWRYDPGGRALMRIEREIAGLESSGLPRETNAMSEDAPYQSAIESDARASDVHPHFQRQLGPIIPGEENLDITLHMTIQDVEEVRVPLSGISARDEDESSLDAELTSTTAIIEDEELIMPVGEDASETASAAYEVSLSLERPDGSGSFELMFEDLSLIEPGGEDAGPLEFDLHYQELQEETLPGFLAE